MTNAIFVTTESFLRGKAILLKQGIILVYLFQLFLKLLASYKYS